MNGELPPGWTRARIGDIAALNPRHPRSLADSLMVSFAPMAALDEFRPAFKFLDERPLGEVRRGFTQFAEGDVLFAKITPCMENGKGAIAKGLRNSIGCGTTELIVLRPDGAVDSEYLYQFLAQPSVRAEAKEHFTSTAGQARVPKEFIEQLEIPIAPISEQKRIVAALAKLHSRVDNCRMHIARAGALLSQFRQAVLDAASSGRLTADWRLKNPRVESTSALIDRIDQFRKRQGGPRTPYLQTVRVPANGDLETLPDSWAWVSFGSVIGELKNGVSTRPSLVPPGTPILRISSTRPGVVDIRDVRFMPNGSQFLPTYALRDCDLLFTRYNGSIEYLGTCAMVRGLGKQSVLYPDKLMRVRFDHQFILPEYAELFFQAPSVHGRLTAQSKSSAGQNGIAGSDIKAQPFALPPFPEQQEIVRRVDMMAAVARRVEERAHAGRIQVETLSASLLAKAFRGDLVSAGSALVRTDAPPDSRKGSVACA